MILAVNTAEEELHLLLAGDGRILATHREACAGRMNEVLAPLVQGMLAAHPGQLERVACVRGPGSFTGVRLGLAFCHGFCLATGIPLAGLDYLPLLAASAPAGFVRLHVLTHSRTARVYHQAFDGDTRAPLGPPEDLRVERARELLAEPCFGPAAALGTGLRRNAEAFAGLDGVAFLGLENPCDQALLDAAGSARAEGPSVEAMYLRGSDAEENLATIAAGRGLSEEEARERMRKALA